MRKEVLAAIILGIILGGVVIYGIQLANNSGQTNTTLTPTPTSIINNSEPTPSPAKSGNLIITSPENNSVVTTGTIKITGKSLPNSTIAIYSQEDEIITTADSTGNFAADFELTGGDNTIKIDSVTQNNKTESLELLIIYTTADLN